MRQLELRSEHPSDGSIHRRVLFASQVILEVTIDCLDAQTGFPRVGTRAEACLVWPVQGRRALRNHLLSAETLFRGYQRQDHPKTAEMWLEGNHYQTQLPAGRFADALLGFTNGHRVSLNDQLTLVLIAAGDLAVEWSFGEGENSPFQCSCACTLIIAEDLARFFREMHNDDHVRSQGEISKDIFANTARPPLNTFPPLQVIV